MKLLNSLALLFCIALVTVSCKKDDQPDPTPTQTQTQTYPNYSQLKVGNYWIYQRFQIDNGTVTPLNIYDSVYVQKDTVIRGNTYYYVYKPPVFSGYSESKWLRDSLHYLVQPYGTINFSSQNFGVPFLDYYEVGTDTLYRRVNQMVEKDLVINTPAGNFVTSNFREEYRFYPAYNSPVPTVYLNHRYAEGIGMVAETLLGYMPDFQHGQWKERRLVRYHLH